MTEFNWRFLFQTLSRGESNMAQFITLKASCQNWTWNLALGHLFSRSFKHLYGAPALIFNAKNISIVTFALGEIIPVNLVTIDHWSSAPIFFCELSILQMLEAKIIEISTFLEKSICRNMILSTIHFLKS